MKINQKVYLTNVEDNLLKRIQKYNDEKNKYYINVVNTIDEETLVYANKISSIDDNSLHILVSDVKSFIDGFDTYMMYSNLSNLKFKINYNLSSNEFHSLKEMLKVKLMEIFVNKDNLLADLNVIIDELLMNAFFNAPIDGFGVHYNKEKMRTDNIDLKDKKVETKIMRQNDLTILSCKDNYGTIETEDILKYVKKGSAFVENNVASGRKGAGIGLSLIYFYSDAVIFDVDKTKSSDIFSLRFDRKKNFKIINILNRKEDMFSYKLNNNGNELIISLKGNIDEDANFKSIDISKASKIIIDFEEVKGLNSCGIREWINFRNTLDSKEVVYRNCRKIIIDQTNIVHGFIKDNVVLESLYLPYFCESCKIENSILVKLSDIYSNGKIVLKDVSCPNCKNKMEFDELEKQYFNFVKLMKK